LSLNEDQTIGWKVDDRWESIMSLAGKLGV
jgi:hypothetical protein